MTPRTSFRHLASIVTSHSVASRLWASGPSLAQGEFSGKPGGLAGNSPLLILICHAIAADCVRPRSRVRLRTGKR